jgi:hypothetical protein
MKGLGAFGVDPTFLAGPASPRSSTPAAPGTRCSTCFNYVTDNASGTNAGFELHQSLEFSAVSPDRVLAFSPTRV